MASSQRKGVRTPFQNLTNNNNSGIPTVVVSSDATPLDGPNPCQSKQISSSNTENSYDDVSYGIGTTQGSGLQMPVQALNSLEPITQLSGLELPQLGTVVNQTISYWAVEHAAREPFTGSNQPENTPVGNDQTDDPYEIFEPIVHQTTLEDCLATVQRGESAEHESDEEARMFTEEDDDLIREEQFVNFAPHEDHATDLPPDDNTMRETMCNVARQEEHATDLPEDDNGDNLDEDFGDNEENATQSRKFVSAREYYCFKLQGLVDTVVAGESRGDRIGKRIVLPRTFPGGDRDMQRRFLDVMAIVQRWGKPDYFITMTCNPYWEEITEKLYPGQLPQDRPDLVARVFKAKQRDLMDLLTKGKHFGEVVAY
ncbi:hypothetical protein ACQ4PT_004226 [Festuca glaucescens]